MPAVGWREQLDNARQWMIRSIMIAVSDAIRRAARAHRVLGGGRGGPPPLTFVETAYQENDEGRQEVAARSDNPSDLRDEARSKETMEKYKPELRKYYYDSTRHKTYLEQLGVAYPPPMPPTQGGH